MLQQSMITPIMDDNNKDALGAIYVVASMEMFISR